MRGKAPAVDKKILHFLGKIAVFQIFRGGAVASLAPPPPGYTLGYGDTAIHRTVNI